LSSVWTIDAQEISLKLKGHSPADQEVLESLAAAVIFENVAALEDEIEHIQKQLYNKGYISLKYLGLKNKKLEYTAEFELGPAYKSILIFGHSNLFRPLGYTIEKDLDSNQFYVEVPISVLENTLEQLSKTLADKSYAFATLQLQNIQPEDEIKIKAELVIDKGTKRTLQNIKVLGYDKFPPSYIKHFLGIKIRKSFRLERIKSQMELLNQLPFAQQKRPAEVLFTKDSTSVYLYLEKIKSNRFDGFIGFGTDETTGKIEFDGYLDLNLINNLNFGESLKLNYKSDEIDQKTLDIALQLPYLFGTPLGSTLNLNIFKKDSTFTTAQQGIKLFYQLNENQQLGLGIRLQQSNAITNTSDAFVEDFDRQFYEINYNYSKRQKTDLLFPVQRQFEMSVAFGKRSAASELNQRQIRLKGFQILNLNPKNSIFLKVHLEELQSDQYLLNELLRFGGITSVRGFRENSLFATRLGLLCSEYRYRLSPGLFVHSVMDAGYFQDANNTNYQIFGFGFGFGLRSNGGLLRLTYANGKTKNIPFDLSESKVHLSFTSTF
jgi:outer membrane protein assembly factor BamA